MMQFIKMWKIILEKVINIKNVENNAVFIYNKQKYL